mmetsp:Transcript_11746/g.13963  ORF Transcript_11746/g.13963 Transcript_11746/m.13963 type:complete len:238 (+) Transcript_11746:957-1670(+)
MTAISQLPEIILEECELQHGLIPVVFNSVGIHLYQRITCFLLFLSSYDDHIPLVSRVEELYSERVWGLWYVLGINPTELVWIVLHASPCIPLAVKVYHLQELFVCRLAGIHNQGTEAFGTPCTLIEVTLTPSDLRLASYLERERSDCFHLLIKFLCLLFFDLCLLLCHLLLLSSSQFVLLCLFLSLDLLFVFLLDLLRGENLIHPLPHETRFDRPLVNIDLFVCCSPVRDDHELRIV